MIILSLIDLQNMPDNPERVTLSQAVERLMDNDRIWVEISRIKWDCENVVYNEIEDTVRTSVVFTDETNSVLGIADFSGLEKVSCEGLSNTNAVGILSSMEEEYYQRLPARGFNLLDYQNSKNQMYLCAFCGKRNSRGLVIVGSLMAIIGLSMDPLSLKARRDYQKKGLL